MPPALSRAETRELERRAIDDFGVPGILLMENAGRSAAELLLALGVRGPVVIACGKGNNGGDGFVIARHLDNHGCTVQVLLFAAPDELRGDAKTNYELITKSRIAGRVFAAAPCDATELHKELMRADWIVDALFGTGLQGPVRPPFDQIIAEVNHTGRNVLAVDIPSGLDCDTGQPLGATIRANQTVTFVAIKKGFLEPASSKWTGRVHVADIGLPRCLFPP